MMAMRIIRKATTVASPTIGTSMSASSCPSIRKSKSNHNYNRDNNNQSNYIHMISLYTTINRQFHAKLSLA